MSLLLAVGGAGGVTVNATSQSLVLTQYQANVALDINVNATSQTLALTTYAATVDVSSGGVDVLATSQAMTLTTYAATIEASSPVAEERYSGGWEDYSRHPYYRPVRKKEREEYIHKQADLEEEVAQVEVEMVFKDQRKIAGLEIKLEALKEELDSIKVLNALLAEQAQEEQFRLEEEELIVLLLAA